MPPQGTHGFVATLSNGTTVAEHHGDYTVIAGERKPFVRLCTFVAENGLYLTSLRYNANSTVYHAPKLDQRWEKGGLHPDRYGIEYIVELEEGPQGREECHYVDVAAYYGDMSVHTIIELGGSQHVHTQLRQGYIALASAPAIQQVMGS